MEKEEAIPKAAAAGVVLAFTSTVQPPAPIASLPGKGAALVLIDLQRAFDDGAHWGGGTRSTPQMEENALALLDHWRRHQRQVVHVRHASLEAGSPLSGDSPGFAWKQGFEPREGESAYVKHVNSAFIGTTLERDLRGAGVGELVILGLTTHHCVSTTTRMASNLGFRCWVVGDACAVFQRAKAPGFCGGDEVKEDGEDEAWPAELVHAINLASLHGEFARVLVSKELLR